MLIIVPANSVLPWSVAGVPPANSSGLWSLPPEQFQNMRHASESVAFEGRAIKFSFIPQPLTPPEILRD